MELRRLLRPLPLVLIVIFVAVAVVDLVQKLGEVPESPPEIAGAVVPQFESLEPVFDFRPGTVDTGVEILPTPGFSPGQWSPPVERGVWARGAAAEFGFDIAVGGHRVMILEALPATGKRRVKHLSFAINGIDCGSVTLASGWMRYLISVPEGVIRAGSNRIVFAFPDRDPTAQPRRSLLIRKLGLFLEEETEVSALDFARPAHLDFETERVSIRRSGMLELVLVLDDRTDALQMRYRFPTAFGRAEVTVARKTEESAGAGDVLRRSVNAEQEMSGRIRIPLHGRRGVYVFRIRADLDQPGAKLLISSLRLVEEGDPTRRPWAANPDPD